MRSTFIERCRRPLLVVVHGKDLGDACTVAGHAGRHHPGGHRARTRRVTRVELTFEPYHAAEQQHANRVAELFLTMAIPIVVAAIVFRQL
jgi:hypothetical protein